MMLIKFKNILIPFSSVNYVKREVGGHSGFTVYYIFGIRIVQIQKTIPW